MSSLGTEGMLPYRDDAMNVIAQELDRVSVMVEELSGAGQSALGGALPHLFRCGGKLLRPLLTVALPGGRRQPGVRRPGPRRPFRRRRGTAARRYALSR